MEKILFISHSSKDAQIASDLVSFFESKGISCFIAPRDIGPGSSYPSQITRAVSSCKAAVLIASHNINESVHVRKEITLLVSENKYFIPFFIEDFKISDDYAYLISEIQKIAAHPGDPGDYFKMLYDAISPAIYSEKSSSECLAPINTPNANNTQKVFKYIPDRGIMINPEDKQRNVSFRTDTFIDMMGGIFDEIRKLSDEEHAKRAFYESGYSSGYSFAKKLNSNWDLSATGKSIFEEKLRKWCEFDSDVGWGKFDIKTKFDRETGNFSGSLTINECFIVDTENKRHICEYVKGYCDGVIETLLRAKVELKCRICPLKNRFESACVFDILIKEN